MKKDRNCGGMYMPYQMGYMMPQPPMPYTMNMNNNMDQQINNLQQQINSLENRIAKLESKTNTTYNNKYNDSNYYML